MSIIFADSLQKIVAIMLRFANNCKSKDKITGHITVPEMKRATTTIIKIIRRESFGNELKKTLKCVCGRQRFIASRWAPKKRVLTTDMKHQILMPKNTWWQVYLLVKHIHWHYTVDQGSWRVWFAKKFGSSMLNRQSKRRYGNVFTAQKMHQEQCNN